MKLVYLTAQRYPTRKPDPIFWRSMAEAFGRELSDRFVFVVRERAPEDLKWLNPVSIDLPWRFRSFTYFLRIPFLVITEKWNDKDTIFFSADPYLLAILIFWRKVLDFKYRICSDWHQLFEDWKDGFIAKGSDYLVSTTEKLKRALVAKCGVPREKILVAYGGVNPKLYERETGRESLSLPEDKFLVGYIGGFRSMGQEKGIDTMIRSLQHLNDLVAVFVGGSKEHIEEYEELARELGVLDKCMFFEKQPAERVAEYQSAMDVLVIPYPDKPHFRDYGFPMKVWEYLAAERPIIYSNLDIIAEVLQGHGTPFVPDSSESLAKAIEAVRANPVKPSIKAYTWDDRARNIISFLSK